MLSVDSPRWATAFIDGVLSLVLVPTASPFQRRIFVARDPEMGVQHIRLDQGQPEVRFNGNTMPRLEFRQALFRTPHEGWHQRLYRAALVVTNDRTWS